MLTNLNYGTITLPGVTVSADRLVWSVKIEFQLLALRYKQKYEDFIIYVTYSLWVVLLFDQSQPTSIFRYVWLSELQKVHDNIFLSCDS